MERRKHIRFSATAFINRPVMVEPLQPFFGKPLKGKLIDLSAGGIALVIEQIIPMGTLLDLSMTFPDHTIIQTITKVRYMIPKEKGFFHGMEFLTLASNIGERIDQMSRDYIDCEARIQKALPSPCTASECHFFTMCSKEERVDLLTTIEPGIVINMTMADPAKYSVIRK